MYYQPSIWIPNPPSSLLKFLINAWGLARFIQRMFFEMKNDPRVNFGLYLFKLIEEIDQDMCKYILIVQTDAYIWGVCFIRLYDLDITNTGQGHLTIG